MECVQKQTIEKIIEGQELNLRCLDINNKKYYLKISNNVGEISLKFYEDKQENYGDVSASNVGDYEIRIDEKGIGFERIVYRPNHDHNDVERLQIIVDKEKSFGKKGELVWGKDFPHEDSGYDFFYIPFGPKKVDY